MGPAHAGRAARDCVFGPFDASQLVQALAPRTPDARLEGAVEIGPGPRRRQPRGAHGRLQPPVAAQPDPCAQQTFAGFAGRHRAAVRLGEDPVDRLQGAGQLQVRPHRPQPVAPASGCAAPPRAPAGSGAPPAPWPLAPVTAALALDALPSAGAERLPRAPGPPARPARSAPADAPWSCRAASRWPFPPPTAQPARRDPRRWRTRAREGGSPGCRGSASPPCPSFEPGTADTPAETIPSGQRSGGTPRSAPRRRPRVGRRRPPTPASGRTAAPRAPLRNARTRPPDPRRAPPSSAARKSAANADASGPAAAPGRAASPKAGGTSRNPPGPAVPGSLSNRITGCASGRGRTSRAQSRIRPQPPGQPVARTSSHSRCADSLGRLSRLSWMNSARGSSVRSTGSRREELAPAARAPSSLPVSIHLRSVRRSTPGRLASSVLLTPLSRPFCSRILVSNPMHPRPASSAVQLLSSQQPELPHRNPQCGPSPPLKSGTF